MGRHLLDIGVRPGPDMGRILRHVYDQQLEGKVETFEDAMVEARRVIEATTD
jgi:tRNA nucleotidyltransferase (CCA-adding enzyme)